MGERCAADVLDDGADVAKRQLTVAGGVILGHHFGPIHNGHRLTTGCTEDVTAESDKRT